MARNANNMSVQEELEQLRTENAALREANTTLQKTNLETKAQLLQLQGETKQDSATPVPPATKKSRYSYISEKIILQFQPSVDPDDIPYEQIAWWKRIFELLAPPHYDPTTHTDRIHLRCLCNMFNAALKPPPEGMKGKWTEFPHPNHPSLESLVARCHQLYDEDPRRAPTILFIKEGNHEVHERYLVITYAMKIVGAGRDKTFIHGGGFRIEGTNDEKMIVDMQDFTMKGSRWNGLYASGGLSFLCKDMTFTQCGWSGVYAENNTKVMTKGRLINCVITQCKWSGIYCHENALIEVKGDQTKVDGNGTSRDSDDYGLNTEYTSSIIHLLFPLTKESVSTNNHGGQNYGGNGTIQTVDSY